MTAFERRLKQAEENAARQDAAAAKARRTVSTGLAKASTEKTGRATNAAGITTLPVFQGASAQSEQNRNTTFHRSGQTRDHFDAGVRERFSQRHPEYTGGESGEINRGLNSGRVRLSAGQGELERLAQAYDADPTQENAAAWHSRYDQFTTDLNEYNRAVEQYKKYNSSEGLKSRMEPLRHKRDEARRAFSALSSIEQGNAGAEADFVGSTYGSAGQALEALRRYEGEYNRLLNQYYVTENQEQQAALQRDSGMTGQYAEAKELQEDMEKTLALMAYVSQGYGDPAKAEEYREYLGQKYGLDQQAVDQYRAAGASGAYIPRTDGGYNSISELYDELERRKNEAASALSAGGYDYERMTGYEQMLQDAEEYQAKQKQWRSYAEEHPALSSIGTVLLSPFQGVEYLKTMAGGIGHSDVDQPERYVPMNVYSMDVTNFVSQTRGAVAEKIEENTDWELFGKNVAAFVYESGMSVADSAMNLAAFGPGGALLVGSGSAAANQARDVIERGGTNVQAFWSGLAAGAAEALFEKVSIDSLLAQKSVNGWRSWLKETLKQSGVEASEEMLTEVSNILSDTAIMGENGGYAKAAAVYARQPGVTEDEAKRMAFLDCIGQVVQAGIGGAFSGGLMGGTVNAVNGASNAQSGRQRADFQGLPMFEQSPFEGLPSFRQAGLPLPTGGSVETSGEQVSAPRALPTVEQNKTASTGETDAYYFDASDTNNSWKDRTYTQDGRTFVQSQDRQRMYEVPKQSEIGFEVKNDGTVVLNDDVVSRLDKADYRDFIKAYASLNLITNIDPRTGVEIDPKPITIKDNGSRVIITQTGINDVAKKIRTAGIKSQDNVSSILLLDRMIENAQAVESVENKHGKVTPFTEYRARFSVGGRDYDVKLYIKNAKQGDRYHYHTLEKIDVGLTDGSNGINDTGTYQASPTSSDPIIRQAADGVNSDSAQNGNEVTGGRQLEAPGGVDRTGPENAVGAARYGFDPYSHLLGRYGAIEPGETPARVVDVPRQTTEQDRVSLTARTVMEAAATPEEFVPEIAEQLVNGSFSYLPTSNQKRADRAAARIQRTGYADALANWSGQVRSGKTSADLVATGAQLYNAAVNAGDTARAMEILHDYIQAIRSGAQATQAARILKTLTPSGQLYMLQKEVNSLNDSLGERTLKKLRRGGEEKGIVLDEALADAFLNAPDESAQEAAYDRLIQSVADQIPPTFADKWNAWRYMAMLANPRTHIRNIVGNVGFQPVRWTKDRLAAAIEAGVSAAGGGQLQRTKSFVAAPELYRAAWNDWANVKDTLSGSKYDDLKSEINSRRRVFQAAPLEAVRKGNSNLLELEDAIFKRVTYTDALAGFLQANGVSAEQLRSGQADSAVLERARAYAGREALRATYQDRNAVSDAVVRGVRALGPFGEAVLPFKRTPANILVRGAEYSPLGLAKALTYDLRQVQQGKMTGADAIDNIAAGLTGTGLMALGAALFSLGLVTGGGGGDEKQAALDQLTGGQNYALNLPDGTSVTLDWLAPEALPFFMGVELMDALGENGTSSDDIFNAISSVSEPMLQMSMLQSLNDLIDSVSYVDSAGKLQALAASAVVSYFSQAIPTIGGQIERTAEERRMSTYTDKSLPLPTDVQYALGRASARIPGWDYQQVPFIDAWGREEVSDPQPLRTFNNFLNPAYTSTRNVTAADEEVQRLYDATGDGGVIPERPRRYIIVDGVRKDLTGEEYVEYATLRGQKAYGLMEDLLDSRSYHSMSDEEKAGAVELVYSYADALSKAAVSDYRPEDWVTEAGAAQRTLGLSTADYLVLRERYGAALSGDKVREAYRQGMEAEEYLEYAAGAKGYNEEARRPGAGTDGPERGGETEGPRSGPVSSPRRREADPAASVPERDNEDEKGSLTIAENAKAITQSGLSKGNQEIAWALAYPEWPEKAEEAGLSMAEYIQYKTATYGCKKKAEKLAALREAGLPVGWYYKVELCKAHVP